MATPYVKFKTENKTTSDDSMPLAPPVNLWGQSVPVQTDDVFSSPVLVDKEQRGSAWLSESKDGDTCTQARITLAALTEEDSCDIKKCMLLMH